MRIMKRFKPYLQFSKGKNSTTERAITIAAKDKLPTDWIIEAESDRIAWFLLLEPLPMIINGIASPHTITGVLLKEVV